MKNLNSRDRKSSRSEEHAHNFLQYQGDCSQRIRPSRPDSEFRILLWCFCGDCLKICELWRQKNWLLHHDNNRLTLPFPTRELLAENNMTVSPQSTLLFSVSPIENKSERPPFWYNWGDRGRIAGCAEHPQRTWLPGCTSNGRSAGNCDYAEKETTLRVIVANRTKVSFLRDGSTGPGNYGYIRNKYVRNTLW
jgi:hypothetical protein